MINFDYFTKKHKRTEFKFTTNSWSSSRSGKANSLFNLIRHQPSIDKVYLYAKDPYKAKYQPLIEKRGSTSLKNCNDSKTFTEWLNDESDIYKAIEECNSNKKRKILTVFGDLIPNIKNVIE